MSNDLLTPVPDENSHYSTFQIKFAKLDWSSGDENDLRLFLEDYRKAGYPKWLARNWLTKLEALESVPARASLLLEYCGSPQRQDLLHGAINSINAGNDRPKSQDEDPGMYFVVHQLIKVDPQLAFASHTGRQPAFMVAASRGASSIVNRALEELKSLLRKSNTSAKDLKKNIFEKLSVQDRSSNTALGFAVAEGHTEIVRTLLGEERRLVDHLMEDNIQEAVEKCQIEIIGMVLDAQPIIAKRLPALIVQYGSTRYIDMWKEMAHWFKDFPHNSDILHLAVREQKVEIIEWLVSKFPRMVIREDERQKVALSYNNAPATRESIRALIVPEIIRLCNPETLGKILRTANGGFGD